MLLLKNAVNITVGCRCTYPSIQFDCALQPQHMGFSRHRSALVELPPESDLSNRTTLPPFTKVVLAADQPDGLRPRWARRKGTPSPPIWTPNKRQHLGGLCVRACVCACVRVCVCACGREGGVGGREGWEGGVRGAWHGRGVERRGEARRAKERRRERQQNTTNKNREGDKKRRKT